MIGTVYLILLLLYTKLKNYSYIFFSTHTNTNPCNMIRYDMNSVVGTVYLILCNPGNKIEKVYLIIIFPALIHISTIEGECGVIFPW